VALAFDVRADVRESTIQTHMQRVVDSDAIHGCAGQPVDLLHLRFGAGIAVVAGALLFIYSQFVVRKRSYRARCHRYLCRGMIMDNH
jgi:hypothetical protein